MIKKGIITLSVCLFCIYGNLFSQKLIKASQPYVDSFPTVKGEIWYRGIISAQLFKDQLSISEEGVNINYTLSPVVMTESVKANKRIVLLIENHYLPRGAALRSFFSKVIDKGIANSINPGDKISVCSFDWHRNGSYIFNETEGFTDNETEIINAVKNIKAKPALQNTQTASDINSSLLESIKFIISESKKDSMASAIFIFSDDLDNIVDVVKPLDIKIESLKNNIPIYSIAYSLFSRYNDVTKNEICLATFGDYFIDKQNNVDECASNLKDFLDNVVQKNQGSLFNYLYLSKKEKNGQNLKLDFDLKNSGIPSETVSIQVPKKNTLEWVKSNKLLVSISFAVFILLVFLIIFLSRKQKQKQKREREELLNSQETLMTQNEKNEQESKRTEFELKKIKQEQKDKELALKNQKEIQKNEEESKRLIKLMLLKGAFPKLNYTYKNQNGSIEISKPVFSIGRDDSNEFFIQLDSVSRKHALINFNENGEYQLIDNNSLNGTMVNGTRVKEHVLKSGDCIQVGDIYLTFQN